MGTLLIHQRPEALVIVVDDLGELEELAEVVGAVELDAELSGPEGDCGRDGVEFQVEGLAGDERAGFAGLALPLDLFDGLFDAGAPDLLVPDLLAERGAAQPADEIGAVDDEGLADLVAFEGVHQPDGLAALEGEEALDGGAGEEGQGSEIRLVEVLENAVNPKKPRRFGGHEGITPLRHCRAQLCPMQDFLVSDKGSVSAARTLCYNLTP